MVNVCYIWGMKRFRLISSVFIILILLIFAGNVVYMVKLYKSIRVSVERDVMAALTDTDIDEMWERAERQRRIYMALIAQAKETGDTTVAMRDSVTISGQLQQDGSFTTTTASSDRQTSVSVMPVVSKRSYSNQIAASMSRQMHIQMDDRYEYNLAMTDSILLERLADRRIYPDFAAVEIVDSLGNVLVGNVHVPKSDSGYDVFALCFNPVAGRYYKAYISPLTRHILSEMAGVIVTVILLMAVFAVAFYYLYRTVSRLRTIEEMKDDFVNNMTHELKTPIAIAYSANDALLNYDTVNDPQKKETYLRIANKQLKRLGELVENILAMSMERRKTMALASESIMLKSLLEEVASVHRLRGDKAITIDVDAQDDVEIVADRTHLTNVLGNLIDNAIKYSGDSVRITIRGNANGISVADDGIGIPAKSLPYIFNKFYRVPHGDRQDVRGYGIGLYYVRSVLDKMGWSVAVRSHEGEGSVFTIKFCKDESLDIVG